MKKITLQTESQAYRGIEKVIIKLANGEEIEIKAWDNESSHSGMDYSIKLKSRDGASKVLA